MPHQTDPARRAAPPAERVNRRDRRSLRGRQATALFAPLFLALILALAGCGGPAESTGTEASGTAATSGTALQPSADTTGTPTSPATETSAGSTGGSGTGEAERTTRGGASTPTKGGIGIEGPPRTVVIAIAGRKVTPKPGSVNIAVGERVLLVIAADHSTQVHVHGIDKTYEVAAGKPRQISFVMREPGSYEVEAHDPDLLLTKLVVR